MLLVYNMVVHQRFPNGDSQPGTGSRMQTAASPKYFNLIFNFINYNNI